MSYGRNPSSIYLGRSTVRFTAWYALPVLSSIRSIVNFGEQVEFAMDFTADYLTRHEHGLKWVRDRFDRQLIEAAEKRNGSVYGVMFGPGRMVRIDGGAQREDGQWLDDLLTPPPDPLLAGIELFAMTEHEHEKRRERDRLLRERQHESEEGQH